MYFITICTKNRECLLSSVIFKEKTNEAQISLLYEGAVADKYIQSINKVYRNICISYYIIMPNHIHLICEILEKKGRRGRRPLQML